MSDGSWRRRSGRARALHGGWRCPENYCGGLDWGHRLGPGGVLVLLKSVYEVLISLFEATEPVGGYIGVYERG